MISLDQARNQRHFLHSLYSATGPVTPVDVPVFDIAEELSLEIGDAIAVAEELQERGLVVLYASATPRYARVRITPGGMHAAGLRELRRRAS